LYPSLILVISISFDLFKIVLLGDNGSAFGLGSDDGGSTLLRDVVGNFIAFGFLDLILILILFILITFGLFNIFLIIVLSLRV